MGDRLRGGRVYGRSRPCIIVNRRNLTDNELDAAYQAPWVIEFDPEGDVVNSWGDANVLGSGRHACYVDYENNVWPSEQSGRHCAEVFA